MKTLLWLTCAVIALTAPLHAQLVRARIIDSGSGAALAATAVTLHDSTGTRRASGFSDSAGIAALRAPGPGLYEIRVMRIGYTPAVRSGVSVTSADQIEPIEIRITTFPRTLGSVITVGSSDCPGYATDRDGLAVALWTDMRTSLLGAVLTGEERRLRMSLRMWEKKADTTRMSFSTKSSEIEVAGSVPFAGLSPATLVADGFIRDTAGLAGVFYLPGPDLLISEEFVETHCFWLDRTSGGGRDAHLMFSPVLARLERVTDIEGRIVLDRTTGVLRKVVFRYVGNSIPAHQAGAHGEVTYKQLDGGRSYISDWFVRVPQRNRTMAAAFGSGSGMSNSFSESGYLETGGEVVRVVIDPPRSAALRGTVQRQW